MVTQGLAATSIDLPERPWSHGSTKIGQPSALIVLDHWTHPQHPLEVPLSRYRPQSALVDTSKLCLAASLRFPSAIKDQRIL